MVAGYRFIILQYIFLISRLSSSTTFHLVLPVQYASLCHAAFSRIQSVVNVFTRGVHVYLNKFEIAVSHFFLIIFINNKFTVVYQISRNAQSPRKYLLILFAGFKQSLKMSSQN